MTTEAQLGISTKRQTDMAVQKNRTNAADVDLQEYMYMHKQRRLLGSNTSY